MNQIIEVKIIKKKVNYIATTPLFPQCKGIAKTKKEALSKLSNSIATFIGKTLNSTLNGVFLSNNFTQIMLDQTKAPFEENIAFNLSNSSLDSPKTFLMKVSSFNEAQKHNDSTDENLSKDSDKFFVNQFNDDEGSDDHPFVEHDLFEQLTLQQKSAHDQDAIVFGFPLNLN